MAQQEYNNNNPDAPADGTLNFGSAQAWDWKPWEELRFGGIYPGKFILVHNAMSGTIAPDNPFLAKESDEILILLRASSLLDLNESLQMMLTHMSAAERLSFNIDHFVTDYNDHAGRVRYLQTLWENGIFSVLRIPFNYESNPKIQQWVEKHKASLYIDKPPAQTDGGAALTDDMQTNAADSVVSVTNPRWEHTDDTRKQKSPDTCKPGDTIMLMADVSGIPEGAAVTFDIFDSGQSPTMRVETVSGKNEQNVGKAPWEVKDPRGNDEDRELKIEFEALAKSKSSGKKEIKVEVEEFILSI